MPCSHKNDITLLTQITHYAILTLRIFANDEYNGRRTGLDSDV